MSTPSPGPVRAVTGALSGLADARSYSGATLAATGLGLWALQRYVFKQNLDPGFAADIYALVPGLIGYLAAHLTRQTTTSTQMAPTTQPAPATPLPLTDSTRTQGAVSGPGTSSP